MSEEYYEETFEVEVPAKLKVSNIRGPVKVSEGDGNKIVVKATKYLNTGDPDSTTVEITQLGDGTVEARTEFPKSIWPTLKRPCKVEYEITTPKSCSVYIKSINSSMDIRGLEGNFKAKSVNGSVRLENLSGEFELDSVNGSLKAKNLSGKLDMESVNGSVAILDSEIESVRSNSVNGEVLLQSPLGEGPYTFHSVSGKVKLVVPEDTGCTIRIHSISGSLRTDLSTSQYSKNHGNVFAEMGGGGTEIKLNSVSGNMYVVTEVDSKGATLSEKFKVKSRKDRLEVLSKLENGELSVEDTLKELNR